MPSKEQIARFLECFRLLSMFEAQHQLMRKWGAFNPADWPDRPDPSVLAVQEWLTQLAAESGSTEAIG
jgi:hypothetical protein